MLKNKTRENDSKKPKKKGCFIIIFYKLCLFNISVVTFYFSLFFSHALPRLFCRVSLHPIEDPQ